MLAMLSAECVLSDVKYCILYYSTILKTPKHIPSVCVCTFQIMLADAGAVVPKTDLLKIFYKKAQNKASV